MGLVLGMRWVKKLVISFRESVIPIVIFSFNKSYKHSAQKISTLYPVLYSIKQNPLNHSIFIPFLPILRIQLHFAEPIRIGAAQRRRRKVSEPNVLALHAVFSQILASVSSLLVLSFTCACFRAHVFFAHNCGFQSIWRFCRFGFFCKKGCFEFCLGKFLYYLEILYFIKNNVGRILSAPPPADLYNVFSIEELIFKLGYSESVNC